MVDYFFCLRPYIETSYQFDNVCHLLKLLVKVEPREIKFGTKLCFQVALMT